MRKIVSGLRAWMVQRVTAVYMLFFIVFMLGHFILDPPQSYLAWHGWMMSSGISITASIFFAALFAHAWVGLRDVIMDYIHPITLRVLMLVSLAFGLTGVGVWVIRILWLGHG
ncbi:MAG: succinate dehydrogenase, hydrophobic membrane anchor protein [Betaproteobacteria bacterium]